MRLGVALLLLVACVRSRAVPCGDEICPPDTDCHLELRICVSVEQNQACIGKGDGDVCSFSAFVGTCRDSVCIIGDQDVDGRGDGQDNCPTLGNADQADVDGDGFGDVCDLCPDLPTSHNHDEDGDTGDECDLCPSRPDLQVDEDRDDVGDVCESRDTAANWSLLGFDPFIELSGWQSGGVPWQVYPDDTIAPSAPLGPTDTGLVGTLIDLVVPTWTMEIGFTSEQDWKAGDRVGLALFDASGSSLLLGCSIECAGEPTRCSFRVRTGAMENVSSLALQPTAVGSVQMTYLAMGPSSGDDQLECKYDVVYHRVIGVPATSGVPVLTASSFRVRYFAAWSIL